MVVLGAFCFKTGSHCETLACNSRDPPVGLNVCAPDPCLFSNYLRDWKDGSTVKSTGWSSSGSGFNYQHHLLDSQPPITPVNALWTLWGTRHMWGTQTYIQENTHTPKSKNNFLRVHVCTCVTKLKRNLPCQGKKIQILCIFWPGNSIVKSI